MSITTSIPIVLLASAALLAQPTVRDVRSAAGNLNPGIPGYGIAPGSLISIAGTNASGDPTTSNYPLTTNLNGVSVKVSVGGLDTDALVVSTSPTRIVALVPSTVTAGTGKVTVTDANGSASGNVTIVDRNFGIFTQKAAAGSVASAYAMNLSDGGNTWNTLTAPATPGQQIAVFGSGAGATTQDETNAVSAESLTGDFQLFIGGKLAAITSVGRSGAGIDALGLPAGLSGIDAITATVPPGVSGCRVAVVAISGSDRVSNFSTIAVSSDGSTCSDPGYLTADDINGLPASGSYNVGAISISRFSVSLSVPPLGDFTLNTDSAVASFSKVDVGDYKSSGSGSYTSIGSCIVVFSSADGSDLDNVVAPAPLDAGAAITLKGPKGTVSMKKGDDGSYAGVSAVGSNSPLFPSQGTPFADAGLFTADNGAGGADVKGFSAKLTNPTPFTWTNQAQINDVTRSKGVNVTWTGGASDATVVISGTSLGTGKTTASFSCTAPASAGSFLVPAAVTLALPPTANSGPSSATGTGSGALLVLSSTYSRFTAPGLDQGAFSSAGGSLKTLNYK